MPRRRSENLQPLPTAHSVAGSASVPQSDTTLGRRGAAADGGRVHLLLSTNALYLQHVVVCLASLLANNPDLFFDIVIVRRATEELDEGKMRRSLARFSNQSLRVEVFTPPPEQLLPLNPLIHYTLDAWSRLWLADFFPAEVNRILYLDCDIVVVGSIAPLWNVDLGGALLGTVDIPGSQRGVDLLKMRAEDGYFNSGVMIIDLKQWRETKAMNTVLNYVSVNPERLPDLDQDALNACFHGRRKRLDYKWNVISPFFWEPPPLPLPRAEIDAIRRDARIIHFNGASKPWSYFCNHPRKAEYERYLEMTEWRDFVPPDRTVVNRARKTISAILPEKTKTPMRTLARRIGAALGRPVWRPEEEWLADFAKGRRDVFFCQIGAHDGKTDDKLHALVRERRWRGVLVEPVKYLFDRLVANYAESQGRLVFENKALMAKDGSATFYRLRQTNDPLPSWYDQLGSFSREVILSHKAAIPNIEDYLIEETVECVSFATLVARHGIERIDMMLIDAEGYDFEILRNIDFRRYHPKLLIYEQKHLSPEDKAEAIRLLKRNGYIVHPSGMNNVAVRSWFAHAIAH